MLIQPWTGNNTNFTIPFYRFWDAEWADVIYDGPIKTLYPPNVEDFTQQMQDEIKEHFYYRQIGEESPQKFLRHFQQTIRLRAHLWKRLIDTETALRPDDAIYNYDMQETADFNGTNTGETTATGNADVTNTDKGYMSETPDGSIEDIANYMSQGTANTATGNTTTNDTSTSSVTNKSTNTLTRKGNIGVMTAAQILGGYREAQGWSAYDRIFGDLDEHFLGVF